MMASMAMDKMLDMMLEAAAAIRVQCDNLEYLESSSAFTLGLGASQSWTGIACSGSVVYVLRGRCLSLAAPKKD